MTTFFNRKNGLLWSVIKWIQTWNSFFFYWSKRESIYDNFLCFFIIIIIFILCTFGFSESSGGYGATSEAFIFSLNNNEGLAPFVSKVRETSTQWAIYRHSYYGPRFSWDVFIVDNADSNDNSRARLGSNYFVPPAVQDRYTVLAGTKYFSPDEVEVFYLDPSP